MLKVRLVAAPVDGAANQALILLLAARLGLPKRAIQIVRGAASREKLILIKGLTWAELWDHLGL